MLKEVKASKSKRRDSKEKTQHHQSLGVGKERDTPGEPLGGQVFAIWLYNGLGHT